MEAKECIKGRRSIRKFTDQPVSHELIEGIVETASYSPSWKHTQITRYIAVEGANKDALAKCTEIFPNNGNIINNAPMVMALACVKNRSGFERDGSFSTVKGSGWEMFDVGIAAQSFCLAAHENGLGTVILGLFDVDKASEVLGIPENMELVALIPVGYAAETPVAPKRKEVAELLSYK